MAPLDLLSLTAALITALECGALLSSFSDRIADLAELRLGLLAEPGKTAAGLRASATAQRCAWRVGIHHTDTEETTSPTLADGDTNARDAMDTSSQWAFSGRVFTDYCSPSEAVARQTVRRYFLAVLTCRLEIGKRQ